MPPVGAITNAAAINPNSVGSPPVPPPSDSGMAAARDAFSSQAGVTVRLLASLPANLGQTVDRSA